MVGVLQSLSSSHTSGAQLHAPLNNHLRSLLPVTDAMGTGCYMHVMSLRARLAQAMRPSAISQS